MKVEPVSDGLNSEITFIAHSDSAATFIKGVRRTDDRRVTAQKREATINPYVSDIAPRLLWQLDTQGWNVLGFEHITGRHVDYSPDSADLPKVVRALTRLSEIECPAGTLFKNAEERLANHTPAADLPLFVGNHLLHTDLNPGNVLITEDQAYLVDWACPTRGIGMMDPAGWVICLITCGHSPASAEEWAALIPTWSAADPRNIDVFARSQRETWREVVSGSSDPWFQKTAIAVEAWAAYRGV